MNNETPTPPPASRPKKCQRPSGPLTRRERSAGHKAGMIVRRQIQRARQPGFTPVRNERISNAVDAAMAVLLVSNAAAVEKHGGSRLHPQDARSEALRQVAAQLPRGPMVFDWRHGAVSKNNDPAYRGLNGDGPRRVAA